MSAAAPVRFGTRFAGALVLALAFASFLCFSLPVLLYTGNRAEFATSLAELLLPALQPALALAFLFAICVSLLREAQRTRVLVLAAALCILLWLQATVLVWEYGLFDGGRIDWSAGRWRGWLDAGLWLFVLLVADARRERLARILPRLAILACLLQGALALAAARERARAPAAPDATATTLASFSNQSNVLHILADGMQTDVVEDLLDEDQGRLARQLDGFTLFQDNLGAFPYTHMSVPAMLGGRRYDNSEPQERFLDQTLGHESIFGAASVAGYDVEVAQPGGGLSEVYRHVLDARMLTVPDSPHFAGWRGARQERLLLGDLVLFRAVPHFVKRYVYNDQFWLLQGLFGTDPGPGRAYLAHVALLRELAAGARVHGRRPAYKFVHLFLSHRPIVMNRDCSYASRILEPNREHVRDQARCTFQALSALLARLRQLGIYDITTVVISGDHGTFLPPRAMSPGSPEAARAYARGIAPGLIGQARPLLLVKPAQSSGALRRSFAPTSIVDTPATIADAAGFAWRTPGESALRLRDDATRDRHYAAYDYLQSEWTAQYLAPMQDYLVRGRGDRIDSWSLARVLDPPGDAR